MEATAAEATPQTASIPPSSSITPIQPCVKPAIENGTSPNVASPSIPSSSETKCASSDSMQPTTSNANPNMPDIFKKPSPVTSQSSPSRSAKRSAKRSSVKQFPAQQYANQQAPGSNQGDQPANNSKASYTANGQAATSTAEDDRSLRDSCRVEVSGYPAFAKARDIWKLFTSYGNPNLEHVSRRSSIISFLTREEANAAINDSMKVSMYGQFLTVKPFNGMKEGRKHGNKNRNKKNNKNTDVASELIPPQRLPLSGSFEEQLGALLAAVRLTQEEVAALAALYADVERALQQLWPGCQAMPFGSLTTGLGVKSSDADCFVNIPPQYRNAQASFVSRARRVLMQQPQLFAEVVGIPRASTPIVKLLHVPTRTRCDLSCKTPLGALNSRLLAFLLHAQPRLLPAALLAKYWAAVARLSGSGRLTNYALTLLLVFYLQARRPPLLPPVARLQAPPAPPLPVDAWDCGFASDPRRLPAPDPDDRDSVADLLGGFFAFYRDFDFETLVVCPYLGRPVPKTAFLDVSRLPAELGRYRRAVETQTAPPLRVATPLCVQDPFEQCHNVASSVSARLAHDLRAHLAFAADAYERERAAACAGFLRAILLDKPKSIRERSFPEYRASFYPTQLKVIERDDWRVAFRDAVFTVFEQILRLELTPVDKPEKTRSKRDKEKYSASFDKPLWKRKQFMRLYESMQISFVEKHIRITEEVLKVEKNNSFPPVEFQVILSFCTNVRNVWVSIKMTAGDVDMFYPFGKYFAAAMQNLVIGTLHASGCMVATENLKKLETMGAVDSNVGNSDFDSDSAPDETKQFTNSNPQKAQQAEYLRNTEKSMSENSSTESIQSNATNLMEVDHRTSAGSTVQQIELVASPADSRDERSTVCTTSTQSNITCTQQTTEVCPMEIEHSQLKNNVCTTQATTGLIVTEKI